MRVVSRNGPSAECKPRMERPRMTGRKKELRRILLLEDGSFAADWGQKQDRVLFFDGDGKNGDWLFCTSDNGQVTFRLEEGYEDLDEGLKAVAERDEFEVVLCNGTSFSRPGRVPAATVLSQLGYRVTRRVHVFAVLDGADDADQDEMRLTAGRRIMGTTGNVVSIEPIGSGDGWIAEIALPFEGVFDEEGMRSRIETEMSGTDLEIAEYVDEEELRARDSEVGKVVSLFGK